MKNISVNMIALVAMQTSAFLMVFLFAESRNDPALRIAALVAGTNLVATLSAIASTILTGKDLTKREDAPPANPTSVPPAPEAPKETA